LKNPYPKKLQSIPIVSAVIELKFQTNIPTEAVFGVLYTRLASEFPVVNKLPVLQLPLELREKDPNLIFLPYYELYNEQEDIIRVSIGPKVLAVTFTKQSVDYPGWTSYLKAKVNHIFCQAFETNIITSIERLGMRYTDFFDENIFQNIDIEVMQNKDNLGSNEKIQLTRLVKDDLFAHQIIISNNAEVIISGTKLEGSLIDIDTYIEEKQKLVDFAKEYGSIVQEAHDANKNLFFTMIKDEYINGKFNPEF